MSGRGRPRKVYEKTTRYDPGNAPGENPGPKDKGSVRRKASRKDEEKVCEKTPGETPGAKDKGSARRRSPRMNEEEVKKTTPGEAREYTTGAKDKGSVRRKGSRKDEEEVKENTLGEARGEDPGAKNSESVRRKDSKKDEDKVSENTPGEAPGAKDKGSARRRGLRKDEEKTGGRTEEVEAPEEQKKNARNRSRRATQPHDTRPPAHTSPERAEEERLSTGSKIEEDQKVLTALPKRKRNSDADPSRVLLDTLEKLKIKATQRSEATKCVNEIQDAVTKHVKGSLDWCKDICVLKTGSHYENVKICESDEFDLMLAVRVERVDIQPFGEDGAFYSVAMKRHKKHPLDRFLDEDKTIRACEMLTEFREKVKEAADKLPYKVSVERKKKGCPAVTLRVEMDHRHIDLDFVLGLEVHSSSWPPFTNDGFKIDNWLGKQVKKNLKLKPYYLVAKYEGTGTTEQNGVRAKDTWRISFSHIEKAILKDPCKDKTGSQSRTCCRKQCLKLLKYLLKKLKEKYPKEAEKLCSYQAKTTLLHACAARVEDSQWAENQLNYCFQQLLQDFEEHLRECQLSNFFIPSHNLLKSARLDKKSGEALAKYIEYERNNVYPLFREAL